MAGIADAFSNAMFRPNETGYGIAASGVVGALPGLYNPNASVGRNFWMTAGGGIVAALLTGLARSEADKENAALYGQYMKAQGADPVTREALVQETPRLANILMQTADSDFKRAQDLKDYEAMTPLITERAGATKRAEIDAENNAFLGLTGATGATGAVGTTGAANDPSGLRDILRIPKEFRKTAIDEQETLQNIEKSKAFANKMFEESKKLTGAKAALTMNMGIPTTEGDQLQGIIDSTTLQLDTTLKKEINSDLRDRLVSLFPRSTDSDKVIDVKKQRFNEILDTLSKSTPVLNMFGVSKSGAALTKAGGAGAGSGFQVGGTYQGKKILSVKRIS